MGLLDDAIREHLELKRLHGADPSEVARQEHEALDPVDRQAHRAPEHVVGAPPASVATLSESDVDSRGMGAAGALELGAGGETAELDMRTVLAPEQGARGEPAGAAEPRDTTGTAAAVPARERGEGREGSAGRHSGKGLEESLEWEVPGEEATSARREHDAEGDVVDHDEESEEDVLEETPDFLRDTPDQERLWFEQRPPRDFDFEK